MAERTCDVDGCERKHLARGTCGLHYRQLHRIQTGKSHHKMHRRTCETCGTTWESPRSDARFCTAKCKGVHLSELNRRKSPLPDDHPVIVLIEAAKVAERERREAERHEAERSKFEWRVARECPGCACWFTPLHTPNAICCSRSCAKRMARQRRRAREHGARGTFTWSEFMRIAAKFDYCCAYCGVKPGRLDPDHVVPLSRGGSNTPSNLLPTCNLCNSSKCAMTLIEWAEWLADRELPTRATTWEAGDQRYTHLTDVLLYISPAA